MNTFYLTKPQRDLVAQLKLYKNWIRMILSNKQFNYSVILMLLIGLSRLSASGPSFTGLTASANTAETVGYNPAGMVRFKESAFYANPGIILTKSETSLKSETAGEVKIDTDSTIFIPSIYYIKPINDKWTFGVGPSGASGIGTEYGDDWIGRYLLDEWSLVFAGVAPAVSYKVNEKLSLGASVSFTYSSFELEKAILNPDTPDQDGSMDFEADGFGVGFGFSLLYQFTENTRIGITYDTEVTAGIDGTPDFYNLSSLRKEIMEDVGILDHQIEMDSVKPQYVKVGIYHRFNETWSMSLDALWIDYSEMGIEDLEVGDTSINAEGSNYQDIYGASAGLRYQMNDKWAFRSGMGYVSSSLKEKDRTIFSRSGEIYSIGAGMDYMADSGRGYSLDISYLQFSNGKFKTEDVPLLGDISGEYDENYGISISLASTW